MNRLILFVAIAFSVLGCGSRKPALTPGEAKAVAIARTWVSAQGYYDPDAAKYEVRTLADGGWKVYIQYEPPTPGSHTTLDINAKDEITDVHPGA